MKLITLFILTSFSLLASNGTGGSFGGSRLSWDEIGHNPNLKPMFEKFKIEGHNISYEDLCLMGERVRTKKRKLVADAYKFPPGVAVPTLSLDYLVQDRSYTETRCKETHFFTCSEWAEEEVEIPTKMEIRVMKKVSRNNWEEEFKKVYQLPRCD